MSILVTPDPLANIKLPLLGIVTRGLLKIHVEKTKTRGEKAKTHHERGSINPGELAELLKKTERPSS